MAVLILSPDQDAVFSLGSALQRRGVAYSRTLPAASEEPPLVIVMDVAWESHDTVLRHLQAEIPWSRSYLIADRGSDPTGALAPAIRKPFDAAAVAEMLERECELALLERRRRALANKAEELGLLLQSSLEAIIGLDRSGKIVFWNRGAQKIYGFAEGEALGQGLTLLGGQGARRGPASDVDAPTEELTRRHKLGHEVTVLVSRSYAAHDRGEPSSIQCAEVSLDVTQRRALERELEHSKRLAHLGRIAATLSHEINNPLAAIRSYSSWLQTRARRSRDADLIDVSNDLDTASERIATFIDQMTGFARRGMPKLEIVSLKRCLGISVRMVRPRAESQGVTLTDESGDLADTVLAHDPTRFGHAVINVLSNAVDAAASGGKHVWLRIATGDTLLNVEIDDDGEGVLAELKSKVFEPFFTTKPFGRGTGLGLWLTEQILQDHGGAIVLEDRPGGGTRVRLSLPLQQESQ
jgi:PAS domain S-box-containing protein